MVKKNKDSSNKQIPIRGVALLSGFLGASASCAAKFAFSPDSPVVTGARTLIQQTPQVLGSDDEATTPFQYAPTLVEYALRSVCLLLMIACNAFMLGSFLEGMEESGSIAGTGLSSGANFVSSALYGYLIFGESFSKLWWLGFTLVICGVLILSTVKGEPSCVSSKESTKQD